MTKRQAAMMMLRRFGQAAAARAGQFAWNRRGEGDEAGYRMWMDVSLAIHELRNVAQPRPSCGGGLSPSLDSNGFSFRNGTAVQHRRR